MTSAFRRTTNTGWRIVLRIMQRSVPENSRLSDFGSGKRQPAPFTACWRAFLLATSAGQRARLMLPTGLLSAVEFPVTSKYAAALAAASRCDFGSGERRPTVWKARLLFVPVDARIFDPEARVPSLAAPGHPIRVEELDSEVESAHPGIFIEMPDQIVLEPIRITPLQSTRGILRDGVAENFTKSIGP